MSHNDYPGMPNSNRELVVDALKYQSTEWGLWNNTSYTARVTEAITLEAATLRDRPLGQRDPVIVRTQDETTGRTVKWAYDGEVWVRLPAQNPQTREFVQRPGEQLLVLRGDRCPDAVTIGQMMPGSNLRVEAITFGGDFVNETGVWEPTAGRFQPELETSYALPNPLESVGVIVDHVRQQSGLPPNMTPRSMADVQKEFGA